MNTIFLYLFLCFSNKPAEVKLHSTEIDPRKVVENLKISIRQSIENNFTNEAFLLIDSLRVIAQRQQNNQLIADTDYYRSSIYLRNRQFPNCIKFNVRALDRYLQSNCHNMVVNCYLTFTEVFYNGSNFVTAENYAIKALSYAEKHNLIELEVVSKIWVATTLHAQGNFAHASIYNEKALERAKDLNFASRSKYIELIRNNLGADYMESRDYVRAKRHFQDALKRVSKSPGQVVLYAKLLDNMAQVNIKIEQLDSVIQYLNKAKHIRYQYDIRVDRNINSLLYSYYYFRIGDFEKAKQYSRISLMQSRIHYTPTNLLIALQQNIKTDTIRASIYAAEYINLKDSLEVAERNNRNKFARIAYETDQIIKEKDQAVKEKKFALAGTGILLLFGACAYIITAQRSRQKEMFYIQEQQRSNEAIYQLIHDQQQKIEEGRTMEKRRIASELHDGVMNRLASTRLNLFILNRRRDAQTIEQCLPHIDGIRYIEQEIRRMAHDLEGGEKGIETSFTIVLEKFFEEQRQICNADLHAFVAPEIDWVRIDSTVKINIYRILQEAIQNCYKYAEAQNIFVTIKKEDNLHHIVISDDGIGFKPKKQRNGIGLRNMKQRTKALSGIFKICSQPGHGTTILITIPINETAYENS